MTDKACAICTKRHEVALVIPRMLECHARPPVQDMALHARFPVVKPDDYCHSDFERDAAAAKAREAAAAESARLDGLVEATQASALEAPTAGAVQAVTAALAPAVKRARRARADDTQGGLL